MKCLWEQDMDKSSDQFENGCSTPMQVNKGKGKGKALIKVLTLVTAPLT